jgi:hypothetical protein
MPFSSIKSLTYIKSIPISVIFISIASLRYSKKSAPVESFLFLAPPEICFASFYYMAAFLTGSEGKGSIPFLLK